MIIFREKDFSRKENIKSVISNGEAACIDIIKCMEFYDTCPNDIFHWVDDVATMKFDELSRDKELLGGLIIFPSLSNEFIRSEYDTGFVSYQKRPISFFKKKIIDSSKYESLLKKDTKGKVVWKHSDKYYSVFFEYLALLLDFRISPDDLAYFGISEDGKIWGNPRSISPKPIPVKKSGITKRKFQNLILEYIYYMNYGYSGKNSKLDKRIQEQV